MADSDLSALLILMIFLLLFFLFGDQASSSCSLTIFHTRSNSFPSRPHPINQEVDEYLSRLSSSETTTTSSISHRLSGLQDLHDCVDRLLQLPLIQQSLAQEKNQKWADELLDRSLRILDVCSTAKDVMLQTKECIQDLQSVIRRRGKNESGVLTGEVRKYLTSGKTVKKALHKALKSLKANRSTFSSLNNNQETIAIVSKLRDVEAVILTVLESVLSFVSERKSKPSSWSLVSKMVQSKRIASDDAHNQFNNLDSCIQDQEEGLECLFRQLIKTRVSPNILNH